MQIKIFTIPALGGELLSEEMNIFLRSKKVLQVENHFAQDGRGSGTWNFCVKYVDNVAVGEREKPKVDYQKTLDPVVFARFSKLREIRKRIASEENVAAFLVFGDDELVELAKMETITEAAMRAVKGIGDKKMEKYAQHFVSKPADEKV